MIIMPKQLINKDFRFIRLNFPTGQLKDKAPLGTLCWGKHLLEDNSPILKTHLLLGGNYAIVGGFGNLLLIESDCPFVEQLIKNNLPITFMVRSGSKKPGGYHFYYTCKDNDKIVNASFKIPNVDEDAGSIRCHNQYVVAPNSKHPTGNYYEIFNENEIAEVTAEQVNNLIKPYIKIKEPKRTEEEKTQLRKLYGNRNELRVDDIINLNSLTKQGNEYFGAHPAHGSTTGMNFWVNPNENIWCCFRHNCQGSGGSWAELLAVIEGIIDCSEAGSGCLRGEKFIKVLEIAQKKYGLKIDGKISEPKKKTWVNRKVLWRTRQL